VSHAFRLQIQEPGKAARVVVIDRAVEIGRDCDGIVIEDPTASRRHAQVEPTEEGLVLSDLGSSNGTVAGGEAVDEPLVLLPGAWFEIGETRVVVHAGRDGDTHNVVTEPIDAQLTVDLEADRPSEGRRGLGQAAAHTMRPGGPVRRDRPPG
jgi:pSer/pThr/pTyr-binding forkhead associated (FHA) protein